MMTIWSIIFVTHKHQTKPSWLLKQRPQRLISPFLQPSLWDSAADLSSGDEPSLMISWRYFKWLEVNMSQAQCIQMRACRYVWTVRMNHRLMKPAILCTSIRNSAPHQLLYWVHNPGHRIDNGSNRFGEDLKTLDATRAQTSCVCDSKSSGCAIAVAVSKTKAVQLSDT